jgi:hypothetical protein
MKNDSNGMLLSFNSEGLNVRQIDFVSPETFLDQTCKAYEILSRTLEIERINIPTTKIQYQLGFDENQLDAAERHLIGMNLCVLSSTLLSALGTKQDGIQFAVVMKAEAQLDGLTIERRRRLQANVVRQERQQSIDSRLLQRSRSLGPRQGDAIRALMKLKKQVPEIPPYAVQFDLEDSIDTDISTKSFNIADHISGSLEWAKSVMNEGIRHQRS